MQTMPMLAAIQTKSDVFDPKPSNFAFFYEDLKVMGSGVSSFLASKKLVFFYFI